MKTASSNINNGRRYVIDSFEFRPERCVVVYHLAEDDAMVGGYAAEIASCYQELITPAHVADYIEELQATTYEMLEAALEKKELLREQAALLRQRVEESDE